MQGRGTGVNWIVVLVALAGTTSSADAAATPPKYRLVDLGPAYTDRDSDQNQHLRFGSFPKISENGAISGQTSTMSSENFSFGPVQDPSRPWITTGYYLRESGGSNLFPSSIANNPQAHVYGISSAGEAVGNFGGGAAFYFNSTTGELSTPKSLQGGLDSETAPLGINARHQIVGHQDFKATLYLDPQAVPLKLETLVDNLGPWDLWLASGINDLGQIVGHGQRTDLVGDASSRYFRLDPIPAPVPEPGSLLVFAVAAGTVLWSRSGRKGRASHSH